MAPLDLIRTSALALGLAAPLRRRRTKTALVIAPADIGSLGDAAMLIAACETLKRQGFDAVALLGAEGWARYGVFDRIVWADDYFYDGDDRALARLLWRIRDFDAAYFVGADVLDGTYNPPSISRRLKILHWFAAQGKRATILGSSFTEAPSALCIETLKALPKNAVINARDPVSKERMERFLRRPVTLVADVAFLTEADPTSEQARDFAAWCGRRRAAGDRIVAINASCHNDVKVPDYTAKHIEIARTLLAEGASLIFVPHDTRSDRSDVVIAEEIMAGLAEDADRIRLCEPNDPRSVKAVLGLADFIVTGRMHVAILGMGAGVPAFSFGYQGKFEGLYQLLGLPVDALLENPADIAPRYETILAKIRAGFADAKVHAATLDANLPRVREMSLANFGAPTGGPHHESAPAHRSASAADGSLSAPAN
ncbi:polysaccharide pyruvyl transferase family protein [Acuticoccus sp. M5D2P5]|uniref:polysaccharide pyruvyl transferase family protein n=1 Tax=Acuticoccus kalidii TaxID=2910977 RepID=UPI001F452292|nr:polysaccharide pyruvyl transferase family protein [Acuticoccus kalidii]MCF3936473.1 polysaccharide pyruvyl transferase family protein [Acuticoccus kalidii]